MTSCNVYEGRLWLSRATKIGVLKRQLLRQMPWGLPRMLYHLPLAEYFLMRLRMELYVPPVANLLRRSPKSPPIRHLTVSHYVPWNIPVMVRTLEEETGWRPPHPELPMRFDCVLEDGHMNRTFHRATGLTVQGVIANNLIQDRLRTKAELSAVVRHYEESIDRCMSEVEERLHGAGTNVPS